LHALQSFKRPAASSTPLRRIVNLIFTDGHITQILLSHFALDSNLYYWKLFAFLLARQALIFTLDYVYRDTITKDTPA